MFLPLDGGGEVGVMPMPMPAQNDDAILQAMLEQAEKLCDTKDALMAGQYRHLRDRVRALIELRLCAQETQAP
jgi:hypothetical protein